MEVKINREIRGYTESMFFGLSMRQFVFAVLGCIIAVLNMLCLNFLFVGSAEAHIKEKLGQKGTKKEFIGDV